MMSVNKSRFIHNMMSRCGFENIFARELEAIACRKDIFIAFSSIMIAFLLSPLSDSSLERSKLASGGMVQKFAGGGGVKQGEQFGGVGIFDSDMIGAGSKDVLNAILSSGKAYDVISGPYKNDNVVKEDQNIQLKYIPGTNIKHQQKVPVVPIKKKPKTNDIYPNKYSIN